MLGNLSVLVIKALMVASFANSAFGASVSINGDTAVDLPSMGLDGTTYSNGQHTLTIV